MHRLSFLLLFLAVTVYGACPPEEDVAPCWCIRDYDFTELECQGEDVTLDQVKRALQALDKTENVLLSLSDMKLGSLPSDFFAGFPIIKIEIEKCEVESLAGDGGKPFAGLENTLTGLDIISSFKADNPLTKLELSHLKNLEDLFLLQNNIPEMGNDWFSDGPDSLVRLIITANGIEKLGDRAFEKLKSLQIFSLNDNRFGPVNRNILPYLAPHLGEIELNNNGLTDIPKDLFSDMPRLYKISLKSNGLKTIDEDTFKSVWEKLEWADFRDNPIECDSKMDWITKLEMPDHLLGKCSGPQEKKDVELEDLKE